MDMIKVQDVKKRFKVYSASAGKPFLKRLVRESYLKTVLSGIGFTVKRGEIVALLGKNGSGKSTMIKILTGVLYPDGGSVMVNGMRPWQDRIRYAQTIGAVFSQHSNLYYDLPPIDTFEYMRHLYQIPEDAYKKRLSHLVRVLELEGVYTRQTRLLSFGERMKCNFVAAVLHNPVVVFLDEATVGIDLPSRFALRRAVMDMRDKLHTTFVIATHIVDDIEALAERIIFLDRGRIIFDGPRSGFNELIGNKKHLELYFRSKVTIKPERYGKVLDRDVDYLKLEIDADRVKSAPLTRLVNSSSVIDYNLYDPELGYILQKFYARLEKEGDKHDRKH